MICKECTKTKPDNEFYYQAKSGKSLCKKCSLEKFKRHYLNNKQRYVDRNREVVREKRRASRKYIYEYLHSHPCVDCGESDPVVLEFDHVRGKKFKGISFLCSAGYKIEIIKAEIEKCVVRCANCHRRKTFNECKSYRIGYPS